jgi:hypothetical protein
VGDTGADISLLADRGRCRQLNRGYGAGRLHRLGGDLRRAPGDTDRGDRQRRRGYAPVNLSAQRCLLPVQTRR